MQVDIRINKTTEVDIAEHLKRCDTTFVPSLSSRVDLAEYAHKLANRSTRIEAWLDDELVGLVAVYCSDGERPVAFVTSVSVVPECTRRGIGKLLLENAVSLSRSRGVQQIELEVSRKNVVAIGLYEECGFVVREADDSRDVLKLHRQCQMESSSD